MRASRVLEFGVVPGGDRLRVAAERLIVAGYTGRDTQAVQQHIDELSAVGVPPPPRVPMLYELDATSLTMEDDIWVRGPATSGEVEPVFVRHKGRWFLGVGSDHTDRELEREDIALAKARCPKPLSATLMRLPDDVVDGAFDDTWDATIAVSEIDGCLYQSCTLASVRAPSDLLSRVLPRSDGDGDIVIFAGTVPLLDGRFQSEGRFTCRLELPSGEAITHTYTTHRET